MSWLRRGEGAGAAVLPTVSAGDADAAAAAAAVAVQQKAEVEDLKRERNLLIDRLREVSDTSASAAESAEKTIAALVQLVDTKTKRIQELERERRGGRGAAGDGRAGDGEASESAGGLDAHAVATAVAGSDVDAEVCFREWSERHPGDPVAVVLDFQVAPRGTVYVVEVDGQEGTEVLGECLRGVVQRTGFAAAPMITTVRVVFRLDETGAIDIATRVTGALPPPPTDRPGPAMP